MKTQNPGLLSLPAGSEGMVLQDGEIHRYFVTKIDTLFHSWGYTPIHTPMADYADDYASSVGVSVPSYTYRFVDRDGHILSLRSDITLFLVKQIHHLLKTATLPLRLCYSDSIFRYQDVIDIGKNEFFQSGAEILGVPGRDGDLEILTLLAYVLVSFGLNNPVLHLGSRELFDQVWSNWPIEEREDLRRTFARRDFRSLPVADHARAQVFSFIGSPQELKSAMQEWTPLLGSSGQQALNELHDRATTLATLVPSLEVRIDLSELGSQSYHSGLVFSAYLPGTDSAIAAGGRYDRLLDNLGLGVPAIGFSIMTSKITSLLHNKTETHQYLSTDSSLSFEKRFLQAEQLRREGKKVRL